VKSSRHEHGYDKESANQKSRRHHGRGNARTLRPIKCTKHGTDTVTTRSRQGHGADTALLALSQSHCARDNKNQSNSRKHHCHGKARTRHWTFHSHTKSALFKNFRNFEISRVVFMPNISTNHAITYTNTCHS
jgi:hypothetical protein